MPPPLLLTTPWVAPQHAAQVAPAVKKADWEKRPFGAHMDVARMVALQARARATATAATAAAAAAAAAAVLRMLSAAPAWPCLVSINWLDWLTPHMRRQRTSPHHADAGGAPGRAARHVSLL